MANSCNFQAIGPQKTKAKLKEIEVHSQQPARLSSCVQGKPPTKKAKVLHKAAWSAKIGAFLHAQGTGQLADGTPTGQDGETMLGWGTRAGVACWECGDPGLL